MAVVVPGDSWQQTEKRKRECQKNDVFKLERKTNACSREECCLSEENEGARAGPSDVIGQSSSSFLSSCKPCAK
jgi:hypothetical protein